MPAQVKPHVAASSVRAAAQRVSNGNAQLALELVGFNQDLGAAMQYVFGNAFVCKVSFARSMHICLCVCVSYRVCMDAQLLGQAGAVLAI